MGDRIVHFEIPANNVEKMSKFYGDLFGWKFSKQSTPGMDYWLIETTGRGTQDLGGGMYIKQDETERPKFFVQVDDIDAHTEKLKQAGGTVLYEKQEIPGFGWSVLATDPENNQLGLFQPTGPSRAPRKTPASKKSRTARKNVRRKK